MKKKFLALILSLVMAFSLTACGDKTASNDKDVSKQVEESKDSEKSQRSKDSEQSEESDSSEKSEASEADSAGEISALAKWYASQDRNDLEATINGIFEESQGLHFFVTIEEPDIIIYNYQYITQLDFSDMSQDEINAYFDASFSASAPTIISDIVAYQETYDIPLTAIRMAYFNADGTQIYSTDITEDYASSVPPADSSSEEFDSLQAWIDSDFKAAILDTVNNMLASSGLTCDFKADGTVLVMEYHYTEDLDFSDFSQEEITSLFDENVVPTFASMAQNLLSTFETSYGFEISDIRLVFYNSAGTLLYEKNLSGL